MRRAPATRDGKRRQPSIFGKQLTRNELVGEYANLWPILEQPFNLVYAETALFGALALRSKRLEVARSIVEDVKFATSTPVALSYVMRGIMRFVFASGMLLYLLIYIYLLSLDFRSIGMPFISISPRRNRAKLYLLHCLVASAASSACSCVSPNSRQQRADPDNSSCRLVQPCQSSAAYLPQ